MPLTIPYEGQRTTPNPPSIYERDTGCILITRAMEKPAVAVLRRLGLTVGDSVTQFFSLTANEGDGVPK